MLRELTRYSYIVFFKFSLDIKNNIFPLIRQLALSALSYYVDRQARKNVIFLIFINLKKNVY